MEGSIENISDVRNAVERTDCNKEANLELFCYRECDNSSSDFIKNCRGLVFHGDKLIMRSYPYTDEYDVSTLTDKTSVFGENLSDWDFCLSEEGTLLRLFYHGDRWYLATHKRLNAFNSFWSSSKSFGDLFCLGLKRQMSLDKNFIRDMSRDVLGKDAYNAFLATLNTANQYMFLVRNTEENRIVSLPPSGNAPTVYHVGTFHEGKSANSCVIGLCRPTPVTFESYNDILKFVTNTPYHKAQGIIATHRNNNKQVKIVSSMYRRLVSVRGNEPSLKMRYFQLRNDDVQYPLFMHLYPEMKPVADEIERILYEKVISMHKNYISRYVNKEEIFLQSTEHFIVKSCHGWYHDKRSLGERVRVTRNVVSDVLNMQTPQTLYRLLYGK
jgi:hypothetical protein